MSHSRSERGAGGLTRREFVGTLTLPLVAAACRPHPYDSWLFSRPAASPVGLFPASSYATDFEDLIRRGLRELGVDVRGRRVLLKPNMVEYENGSSINTHPLVVAGAALAFRAAGADDVAVGEGPGHRRDLEYLLTATGLFDHLQEHRIRFVDLNHDDVAPVALRSRFSGLTELAFSTELLRADFIVSMPKLKTHHWAGMTASMKNLFGTVPGAVYGWPKNILHLRGIDNAIVDLNATLRPDLAIVDAVTAMEGDGPIMGRPRPLGFVAMGRDPVAVDATCARIIGLDPYKLPYLEAAGRFLGNLETRRIQQRGESPARYATTFDVVEHLKHLRIA